MERVVFPASAGMIPCHGTRPTMMWCVPRIRGDDPEGWIRKAKLVLCSPHPRG